MYGWAVKRHLIGVCIYGQVIKKRKKNRITSVQRRLVRGSQEALENVLLNSEDSSTLNTSFVERHNLTIRQGSSYLRRRTACHARQTSALKDHLELLQLHWCFIHQVLLHLNSAAEKHVLNLTYQFPWLTQHV